MPASNSIATPSGRRKMRGESSVRKTAMPKLTGMAMSRAMPEVTSVPIIGISAPNLSLTGSQSGLVRKPKPNAWMAGMLPTSSETMIAASNASTPNAETRVRLRNSRSNTACRLRRASRENIGMNGVLMDKKTTDQW